jgi:hypothetical protein
MDSTPPPQTFLFKKWKIELPLLNRWVIMSRDIFSKELENNYIFFQRLGKQIIKKKSLTSMPHPRISNGFCPSFA